MALRSGRMTMMKPTLVQHQQLLLKMANKQALNEFEVQMLETSLNDYAANCLEYERERLRSIERDLERTDDAYNDVFARLENQELMETNLQLEYETELDRLHQLDHRRRELRDLFRHEQKEYDKRIEQLTTMAEDGNPNQVGFLL